ncbi:hypothetical protein EAI_16065 [Harpegnathos saltator]|uniref:Uncharacterized protein n=2 Tax=Harpegnathos saltator TaxID=610380 RepID=E2C6M5_HARSA|nr:hypothetical protein EAI_16065 [Harpegnathos saltator]
MQDQEVNNYLRVMQSVFWEKIKAYGCSNLPDYDVSIDYDIDDGLSYDIKGTLYLEDGFVMDIEDIALMDTRKTTNEVGQGFSMIRTPMRFVGLSFFRDFRFKTDNPESIPDQMVGSIIITPTEFFFNIMIRHYFATNVVNCTMSKVLQSQVNKKSMHFYPSNTLTDRLRKNYVRIYRSKNITNPPLISEKIDYSWQKILEPILNEVVATIPFPKVEFKVERN